MKIQVDRQKCSGHGRCFAVAPGVYEPDDEGFVVSAADGTIDVPAGEEAAATLGVQSCPEGALAVAAEGAA